MVSTAGTMAKGRSAPPDWTTMAVSAPRGIMPFTPEQVDATRILVDASRAASMQAEYLQYWAAFGAWCREHGHCPLPVDPAAVAAHPSGLVVASMAPQTLAP